MLVKRKLIIKGKLDTPVRMRSTTCFMIPMSYRCGGFRGTRRLLNIAKLLKQGKVNFLRPSTSCSQIRVQKRNSES